MVGDLAVVEEWLDAVNEQDAAHVEALSREQVEVVGPRGQGEMDRSVLGQWLTRAGIAAQTLRWFCGGDGRVVRYARYDQGLADALTAAGLDEHRDLVTQLG